MTYILYFKGKSLFSISHLSITLLHLSISSKHQKRLEDRIAEIKKKLFNKLVGSKNKISLSLSENKMGNSANEAARNT